MFCANRVWDERYFEIGKSTPAYKRKHILTSIQVHLPFIHAVGRNDFGRMGMPPNTNQ